MSVRPPFTYTVIESVSERPHIVIGSIPTSPADIVTLYSLGVRGILSLTRRDIRDCPAIAEALKPRVTDRFGNQFAFMDVGHYPIPDGGIADEKTMTDAVDWIESYSQRVPVYVHCRGGIGRSGTVLAAYFMRYRHMTLAQALDTLRPRRNYEGNATAADMGGVQRGWLEALEKQVHSV
jgi:Swiss Army Knife protein, DSP-PTPase phosphatase domain